MNKIMLCFEASPASSIEFANEYWASDENGRWIHTVKDIAERWDQPQHQIAEIAGAIVKAFYMESRCPKCSIPREIASRADFQSALKTRSSICCRGCNERERSIQLNAEADRITKMNDTRNKIWLDQTGKHEPFDYYSLSYSDAVYAFALFVGSEFNDHTGEILLPTAPPFAPTDKELGSALKRLNDVGALQFGQKTPQNAFVPNQNETTFSYYFLRVSWQFAMPEFATSYASLHTELAELVDEGNANSDYSQAVSEIWWQIGRSETLQYLNQELDKYGLSIEEGDKLREAIRYVLTKFSIPQARNLIWRVVKNAAAYSAQRDVYKRQAINTIPGALIRMCDRALADSWVVKPFMQKWDEEECLLTTTLFDRVLKTGVVGFQTTTGLTISDNSD
jgi:hypothetical protein